MRELNGYLPPSCCHRRAGPAGRTAAGSVDCPTRKKLETINALVAAGIKKIQVTSFVHPQLVPQMADAGDLCSQLDRSLDAVYSALVLNEKGVQRAADAGLKHVGVSISASDTHSRKNANASLEEAGERMANMIRIGRQKGLVLRGGVQCAFGCRYEGRIDKNVVMDILKAQLDLGVDELTLADSTGMAHPGSIRDLAGEALELAGHLPVYLHLHDTEGKGLANAIAGMAVGISYFETALGGMGAALSSRALRATCPPRTWCACSTRWASKRASTSSGWQLPPGNSKHLWENFFPAKCTPSWHGTTSRSSINFCLKDNRSDHRVKSQCA